MHIYTSNVRMMMVRRWRIYMLCGSLTASSPHIVIDHIKLTLIARTVTVMIIVDWSGSNGGSITHHSQSTNAAD